MLVRFTAPGSDLPIFLEHTLVILVQRAPGNPLITQVMTTLATPKGFAVYETKESPETVSDWINLAHQGQVPPNTILSH